MAKCDPPPRKRLGGGAPVIKMTRVDPKMLGSVIGPKGANVLKIIEKFKEVDAKATTADEKAIMISKGLEALAGVLRS